MKQEFMNLAFYYAKEALKNNEVPVGVVIVKDDKVVSFGFNLKEKNNNVLDHAELIAIKKAEEFFNNWRLDGCELYVTLDPCPMCASAIKQARIKSVYSALSNSDQNNTFIIDKIFQTDNTNPSVHFVSNLDVEKSKLLLNSFFEIQRNK